MEIYRTNKSEYFSGELKVWLKSFVFYIVLYLILTRFIDKSLYNTMFGIVIMLLIQITDFFKHYHITTISINNENNLVILKLKSRLSGIKKLEYPLQSVRTELTVNHGIRKLIFPAVTLKLFISGNKKFRITPRYGFEPETLIKIHENLKLTAQTNS